MDKIQSPDQSERLFFMDNLRIALTVLVVMHHQSLLVLAMPLFLMLNQAYFMGLFFFLSGCFTPASYDRKGMWIFLKDRLIRLGIPILIYVFILSPIAGFLMSIYQNEISGTAIISLTWKQYSSMIGIGPLWFLVMLLIFDICYFLGRGLIKNKPGETKNENYAAPGISSILLFILIIAIVNYLIRIIIPINKYILFFPSLAYLPQYVSFFILGIISYRQKWLNLIPAKLGKTGFILAIAGTIILMPLAISNILGSASDFTGGGTWKSGVYSLWDSLFSVGLCLGLLVFFRRYFNHQKNFGKNLQRSCFTVYIIHSLIIFIPAYFLYNLQIIPQLKFILASCISVPLSFVIAYLIGKIPIIKKD